MVSAADTDNHADDVGSSADTGMTARETDITEDVLSYYLRHFKGLLNPSVQFIRAFHVYEPFIFPAGYRNLPAAAAAVPALIGLAGKQSVVLRM